MKAMLLMGHGGPEMLRYGEAGDPTAGPGEVVVDIHAASVNGADPKVRREAGATSSANSPTSWAATSPASSARSAPVSPISKSATPCSA